MSKCKFCANDSIHEKAKHCKSCNFAFMAGRAEALTKAKNLVRSVELQAWAQERERILGLLEKAFDNHTKVLQLRPTRSDSDVRHTVCRTYQEAIDLVRGN